MSDVITGLSRTKQPQFYHNGFYVSDNEKNEEMSI